MPRTRTTPEPRPTANSFLASAANVTRGNSLPKKSGQQDWQTAAWNFYDTIGEYRYAANWIGNALSRVDLQVFHGTDDGPELIEAGPEVDALDALFNGDTGQSQMMATLGVHLTVPGESYIVGEPQEDGSPDQWFTLSTDEVQSRAGKWTIDRGDGKRRALSEDALIIRVWRPHPRRFLEADSATRACLPVLRELEQLTKHVAATIDSRLAGAGMLLIPSEMTFASPAAPDTDINPDDDPFLAELTEAMITPIEDRSSAAAVVPIVLKAPGALLGQAQHITFATPFDAQAQDLRVEGIRRLALGMDMPPEILLGQGDSNHWSAWQIEESALKVVIEPLCELICDALTHQYLWPVLGLSEGDVYVGFDTAALRLRPNRSSEAVELYDRLELSGEALRRETGFDESDRPTDQEVVDTLTRKLALGPGTPEITAAAIGSLGVPVPAPVDPAAAPTPELPPAIPSPVAGPPEQSPGSPDNLAASVACELLALRGLERATNRISKRGTRRTACTVEQADAALVDAWENVGILASAIGMDADDLTRRLDSYARAILYTGGSHSPELLRKVVWDTPAAVLEAAYRA